MGGIGFNVVGLNYGSWGHGVTEMSSSWESAGKFSDLCRFPGLIDSAQKVTGWASPFSGDDKG